jgi:hypothetical protein
MCLVHLQSLLNAIPKCLCVCTVFLIFINDIIDEIVGLGPLFADDTSIGHIAQDESTLKYD